MAISTTGSQVLYTGTNSPNQVCPFPYIFFANTDLEVVTLDASNVSRTLVLGTDYSVTGANNTLGGSVTLFAAVPTTTRISVVRNNPETQLVSLTTGDRFPASIMERALDKLTMLCQELGRAVSKTLRVADVSSSQPVLNPLPTSVITTDTSNQFQFSSTSSATGDAPFFLAATTRGGQPTFQSIPTGAIGSTQIADGAVGSSQLATGAVGETQLATGAVTSAKIATGAVGTTQIVDSSVTSAKIATGAVGTTQIADASVTTSKLADSFVTTNTRQTITAEKVIQVLNETTSNTSISASLGNKSFVVGTGLNWVAGDEIKLLVRNTASLWLRGSVLSYNTSTGAMTASITNNNIGGFGQSYNDWVVTRWAGGVPALRITSTDIAPALLVEDSTNPDTTPFTISSTGRVGIGVTPDASVCLSLDTTGVKFGDGTIQTTAGGGGGGGVSSVGGTAPISSSGGTTPTISITAASTTGSGAVQLTDSTTSTSITTAATPNSVKTAFDLASGKVSSVAGTAPISSSGGTTPVISIATASATTSGSLSSTDWNTFNNKGAGTITSVTGTSPIASSGGATPVISIAAASTTASGAVQLTDSTTSTSITTAATPNSVKTAFDLASGKVSKTGDTMTGSLNILAPVQVGDFDPTYDGSRIQINPSNIDLENGAGIIWGGIGYPQAQDSLRNDIRAAGTGVSNTFTSNQIVSTTSANTALRVTQLGTGESFRVEDSTNPDTTAFVISSAGKVGIGVTPDASVSLSVDTTGIKFGDGTIQTTASTGGNPNLVTTNTRQTITSEKVIQSLYESTSTSSLLVGTGTKTLTIGTGLNWVAGSQVRVTRTNGISYMSGDVISYDAVTGQMQFNCVNALGSGFTYSSWNITQQPGTAVPALRITANDSPHVFVVEDSTHPDTTPFTISSTGRVGIGIAPDTTACLSLDTTGVKFGDGTIQTTAATGASYLAYAFETMDHFNGSSSPLQLTGAGVAGGSAAYVNPTTYNGFGIFRIETQNSTTANSGARINQTGTTISFSPKGIGEFRHISRAMRISADMFDGTIQGTFRTGIGDVINAVPNNGIYFQCLNSNSVAFVTRSSGVETLTNTGFSILQDAWNSFEFILATDGLSVVAKINNNIVATHTTNIPNAYMGIISFLQKQVAVAGYVRFDFDFIYQKFTPSPIPFIP